MKIGIGAKLTTGMTLTPQMQQAIRLLQLSSIELEQEVQLKLDSNPMLEREEDWQQRETVFLVTLVTVPMMTQPLPPRGLMNMA